ncbi:MAG: IS3 family transposase, partial [Rhodocyclaceae bacterium]|nr:IS3 family transposase [Rhodocyclaceae bacterium]
AYSAITVGILRPPLPKSGQHAKGRLRQPHRFASPEACTGKGWKRVRRLPHRARLSRQSFEYIEVFYNRKRQHSTLGYLSPTQFMENWLIEQQQEKLVA